MGTLWNHHNHCLSVNVQAMGISRYVFFSIFNADKHPEVPLMNIKAATEEYLAASGLDYTVMRLCGFMQVNCRSPLLWIGCHDVLVCPKALSFGKPVKLVECLITCDAMYH